MPSPPPSSAQRARGARSREEILDAAERLMSDRGYAATPMSALAAESGLPASSIYWHFGSKSGLLAAVMERGATRFFAAATPGDLGDHPDPHRRLQHLLARIEATMVAHRQFLRLFFVLLLGAVAEPAQQELVRRLRAESNRLLARGLAWVYLSWGEEVAGRVGAHLAPVAQALIDGKFLAVEAGGDVSLVADAATALHAVAERVRDGVPSPHQVDPPTGA
jgi:AcrR family transcriptional regulator